MTEEMQAVILAGGRGTRLRPYTLVLPKPLVPVGDQPVLGLLLKQLRKYGFREIFITLGYMGSLIRAMCEDQWKGGLNMTYVQEQEPLGTIGPLALIRERLSETFLVTNGDVIADLNLRKLVEFHQRHGGVATVACHRMEIPVKYGVIGCNGGSRIVEYAEKPRHEVLVNMGMYVFSREILDVVPEHGPFGADDLMHALLARGKEVHSFVHQGQWLDIGSARDLEAAQGIFENHRETILGD